jgi:putative hydrolase of the HAD superfamily
MVVWDDVVNGRRPIEPALAAALEAIGSTASVEDVLGCWFEADYVPIQATIDFAQRASLSGVRVVLATNQEHRRARFLVEGLGAAFPLDGIVYAAEVGAQKHESRFFDVASECLGISLDRRAEVLFVDDTLGNVHQASASGWTAIHADASGAWIAQAERVLGIPQGR